MRGVAIDDWRPAGFKKSLRWQQGVMMLINDMTVCFSVDTKGMTKGWVVPPAMPGCRVSAPEIRCGLKEKAGGT